MSDVLLRDHAKVFIIRKQYLSSQTGSSFWHLQNVFISEMISMILFNKNLGLKFDLVL